MIVLLFEIRASYLGTLEPEYALMMKWSSRTEKWKSGFSWKAWDWAANTITKWYVDENMISSPGLLVLAVISVFAVCRFSKTRTSFSRKSFSRRNNNFRVLQFLWISAHPASGAYRKHWRAFGLPKTLPSASPDPFPIENTKDNSFISFDSVLYDFHVWAPTVA